MNRHHPRILNDYAYCEGKFHEDFENAVSDGFYDDMSDEEFEAVLRERKKEQELWDEALRKPRRVK